MGILTISLVLSLLLFLTPFVKAESVKSWEDLAPHQGRNSYHRIDGKLRQQMFLAVFDQIQRLYRGSVDGQIYEEIVLLCPETADFLYSPPQPASTENSVISSRTISMIHTRYAGTHSRPTNLKTWQAEIRDPDCKQLVSENTIEALTSRSRRRLTARCQLSSSAIAVKVKLSSQP